jgi:hypothetical protein
MSFAQEGDSVMRPIALTDEQLAQVMQTAKVLHPADRSIFLERLAERLRGVEVIGDGLVARTARETLRELFRAPDLRGEVV